MWRNTLCYYALLADPNYLKSQRSMLNWLFAIYNMLGTTMKLRRFDTAVTIILALLAMKAYAFDVDGFRSGITKEQLSAEAMNRGLEVKEGPYGNWFIGKFSESRIDGTFLFCGKSLVSYNRSIDFDVDYVPTLNSLIEKHGQPRSVRVTPIPWSGPGGGNVKVVKMAWYVANEKIVLSLTPEGRDGKGQLRHNRAASINYNTKNQCTKEF